MNVSSEKTSSERQHRVLIVDDERDIRDLLARLLAKRGFEVAVAENGNDALRKMMGNEPDVLLLDISMPKLNGIELLKFTRDLGRPISVVCAISGVADDAEVDEILTWGATDFFRKPLDLELLVSCIQRRLAEVSD